MYVQSKGDKILNPLAEPADKIVEELLAMIHHLKGNASGGQLITGAGLAKSQSRKGTEICVVVFPCCKDTASQF